MIVTPPNGLDPNDRKRRVDLILKQHQDRYTRQTDRLFIVLFVVQYLCGIAVSLWISPFVWAGLSNQNFPHLWAAMVLGAIIIAVPLGFAIKYPTQTITRHLIAAGEMLSAALIIQLFGGRIETHFLIFGSLAFLAFYRDWKVLLTATMIIAVDHLLRGIYWPQSVFGGLASDPWRAIEHAGWVLFEDVFLIWSCHRSSREMQSIAEQQVTLESTNERIEMVVKERTADLATSQRELVRSQNAIRAIVDTAADGIITMDRFGNIESVNRAAEHLFCYDADTLVGKNIDQLINRPDSGSFISYYHDKLSSAKVDNADSYNDMTGRRCGGITVPIEISLSEVYTDGEQRFTAIVREVSSRKEAEAIMAEKAKLEAFAAEIGRTLVSEGGLQDTLQRCTDAIVTHLDAAFVRIWTVNDVSAALETSASASVFTQIEGPNGWRPEKGFEIGLIAEEKSSYLSNHLDTDIRVGNHAWSRREGMVAFAGHPLIVEDRLLGVIAIFARNSISESTFGAMQSIANSIAVGIDRAQNAVRLNEAIVVAKQASVVKSQFLANMSHELRTPMNAIIGYTEMLVEEIEDVGHTQYLSDLKKIRSASKHLLDLINDILDVSKIEAGKMLAYAEEFDVGLLLEDVVSTISPLISQKQNTLTFEPVGILGRGCTDQTKIRQILYNLLSNAAKFTENGRIVLNAARIEANGKGYLQLRVSDSGIGMTPEQLKTIGQPFTQAESSTTRRFGGTGLGLTITKYFCDLLGGELTITSEIGVGSTFQARILAELAIHKQLPISCSPNIVDLAMPGKTMESQLNVRDNWMPKSDDIVSELTLA